MNFEKKCILTFPFSRCTMQETNLRLSRYKTLRFKTELANWRPVAPTFLIASATPSTHWNFDACGGGSASDRESRGNGPPVSRLCFKTRPSGSLYDLFLQSCIALSIVDDFSVSRSSRRWLLRLTRIEQWSSATEIIFVRQLQSEAVV